jgi:hypothetical protein
MSDRDPPALEPWLQQLLAEERTRGALPPAVSADIERRLDATLATPRAEPGAGHGAGAAAPSALRRAWPAVLGSFVAGALTGAVAMRLLDPAPAQHAPPTPPARLEVALPAPRPLPRADAPAVGAVVPADAAPSDTIAPAAPAAPRKARSGDGPEVDRRLRDERALLELARTAFERGRAREALDALQEHARRFASGRLSEERESLRVPVLVELGRHDEARQTAARFHARYPGSLFLPLVEQALRSIP